MVSTAFKSTLVALAATMVSAQTSTDCNPLKTSCPADPAFGSGAATCDFTKGACDTFDVLPGTTLSYNGQGAVFTIQQESNAPTVRSPKYIFFGKVDVVVQAAAGAGIVTSSVLQSDDLDEIDWEWVGGDNAQVQSNWYSKGDTATYNRGAFHPVASPLTSTHTYTVEWTSQQIQWIIDGAVVRTLTAASQAAGYYPQSPMQVKLGTWVGGGKNSPPGTVQWAGGYTDFSKAPFNAYYKSITITDYAGKDAPTSDNVKQYVYGDHSGSWSSIQVIEGNGKAVENNSTSTAASSTTATSTVVSTHSSATKAATTKTHEASASASASATGVSTAPAVASTLATSTSAAASSAGTPAAATSGKPDKTGAAARTAGSILLAGAAMALLL